jgi:hypothetical protein
LDGFGHGVRLRNRLTFREPTARITVKAAPDRLWQPLRPDEVAATVQAATTPQARLFVVLAAVHAARPGQTRAMQLGDLDLPNRRITIGGRDRPLDDLTHQILLDWLDHRRSRWPGTANRHLVISFSTALAHGPVSATVLAPVLRGLPATIERLRIEWQLDEALANGADPLHVAAVFGISDTAAIRCAANARTLLDEPHQTRPVSSPRTRGFETGTEPRGPWSSR